MPVKPVKFLYASYSITSLDVDFILRKLYCFNTHKCVTCSILKPASNALWEVSYKPASNALWEVSYKPASNVLWEVSYKPASNALWEVS